MLTFLIAADGRQIHGQSSAMVCPSHVLPTASMLSDDRGELREITTDRYGADTLFLPCLSCKIIVKQQMINLKYSFRQAIYRCSLIHAVDIAVLLKTLKRLYIDL